MILNKERIMALVIAVFGIICAVSVVLHLPMTEEFTLGPGALPLIYALLMTICSIWLFATAKGKEKEKVEIGGAYPPALLKGILFTALTIGLAALSYVLGFVICLFIYSFVVLKSLGWVNKKALIFSILWVAGLYFSFHILMDVPFLKGYIGSIF